MPPLPESAPAALLESPVAVQMATVAPKPAADDKPAALKPPPPPPSGLEADRRLRLYQDMIKAAGNVGADVGDLEVCVCACYLLTKEHFLEVNPTFL